MLLSVRYNSEVIKLFTNKTQKQKKNNTLQKPFITWIVVQKGIKKYSARYVFQCICSNYILQIILIFGMTRDYINYISSAEDAL